MTPQISHQVLSSFILWLDNKICTKGLAYTNTSSTFYRTNDLLNGNYSYSSPYKQWVADSSIPGASIITGVYVGNTFIRTGQSGFTDINYAHGQVYMTGIAAQTVSGSFAIKDFNIVSTNASEQRLLFETKYEVRPKVGRTLTGLRGDEITYPIIWVKFNTSNNEPFCFGGTDITVDRVRAIVVADNQFNLDAVTSILRDTSRTYIPLINSGEMPFNPRGGFRSGSYNYTGLANKGADLSTFINRVDISFLDAATN